MSVKMRSAACLIALLACMSCATSPRLPSTPEASIEKREAFDTWIHSAFPKANGDTATAIQAIGDLLSKSSVPYDAAHAEGEWKVTTYRFDGLTITAIVQEAEPRKALISGIDIQSKDWPLANGLAVGEPVSDIDMPVRPTDKPLKYCGMTNCIEFAESSGRISQISLSLYAE